MAQRIGSAGYIADIDIMQTVSLD